MIKKSSLLAELKLGKVKVDDRGFVIEELDKKTGEPIDEFTLEEILTDFVGKEVSFKVEHIKEM